MQIWSHVARYGARLGCEPKIDHFTIIIVSPSPELEHGSCLNLNGANLLLYRRMENHPATHILSAGFTSGPRPPATMPIHLSVLLIT